MWYKILESAEHKAYEYTEPLLQRVRAPGKNK